MNTNEGLHRLHLLARRITRFGTLAGILLWLLIGGYRLGYMELLFLVGGPLAIGMALQVVCWVLEGFAPGADRR